MGSSPPSRMKTPNDSPIFLPRGSTTTSEATTRGRRISDSSRPAGCAARIGVDAAQRFKFRIYHLGVSENVVYPIVPNGFADHYPYDLWKIAISLGILTQHFQTNPPGYGHTQPDQVRKDVFWR